MHRPGLQEQLDAAVMESRLTVLYGLPRVGRTRLATRWAAQRGDVAVLPYGSSVEGAAIILYDHVNLANATAFANRFRELERTGNGTRFVLVPIDLAVEKALQATLAGSAHLLEVPPIQPAEFAAERLATDAATGPSVDATPASIPTNAAAPDPHFQWLRGGLPESLGAETDGGSLRFRRRLISGLLARDYGDFRVTEASRPTDILNWIANQHAGEFDEDKCQLVRRPELRSVVHVLERLCVVRRLPNFPAGSNHAMTLLPKMYVRDSGILHALLGIETLAQLRGHHVVGDSWEGYGVEALTLAAGGLAISQFYRVAGQDGADEIDLVLDFSARGGAIAAIEFKVSADVGPRPGFERGCAAIGATERFLVHSGDFADTGRKVHRLDIATALGRVREMAAAAARSC